MAGDRSTDDGQLPVTRRGAFALRLRDLIRVVVLVGVVAAACSGDSATSSTPEPTTTLEPTSAPSAPTASSGGADLTIAPVVCDEEASCLALVEIDGDTYAATCGDEWVRPALVDSTTYAMPAGASDAYGVTEARSIDGFEPSLALAARCDDAAWHLLLAWDPVDGPVAVDETAVCAALVARLARLGCVNRTKVERLSPDGHLNIGEPQLATLAVPDFETDCDIRWIVDLDGRNWRTDNDNAETTWRPWLAALGADDVLTVESVDLVVELRTNEQLIVGSGLQARSGLGTGTGTLLYLAVDGSPPCR